MFDLIEQLKAATAGRYRIFTEVTEQELEIICLDQQFDLVLTRRLSTLQLKNRTLQRAVIADLMGRLTRTQIYRGIELMESRKAAYQRRNAHH